MTLKKTLVASMLAGLALTLGACAGEPDQDEPDEQTSATSSALMYVDPTCSSWTTVEFGLSTRGCVGDTYCYTQYRRWVNGGWTYEIGSC